MPIPKVGDVIELINQPWFGGDWAKLQTERYWVVTGYHRHSDKDYHRLNLRGLNTEYVPWHQIAGDGSWPLEDREILINQFLSQANQAILNNQKENT